MTEKKSKTYLLERIWRRLINGSESIPNNAGAESENYYLDKIADTLEAYGGIVGISALGGGGSGVPYTVWSAQVSQSGVGNPTYTVLENTIGVTVTTLYWAAGDCFFTFPGNPLTANKTAVIIINQDAIASNQYGVNISDTQTIEILSYSSVGAPRDNWNAFMEVRVYP